MEELNLKARSVLETIYNNGGEATTAEIKENTGLKNPQITKYHAKDVLADRGFTTYTMIETEEHPSGVLKFELTEKGEDRIAHLFEDGEDIPIKNRMEDVEDRFHEVENTVSSLYGDVEYAKNVADDSDVKSKKALSEATELREEVEDLDEELGLLKGHVDHDVDNKIENLEGRLEKVEDTLSDLRGLDHRVADIETKLNRLDIPEAVVIDVDGEEIEEDHGEGAVGEEADGVASDHMNLRDFLDQLDLAEEEIYSERDLVGLLNRNGFAAHDRDLDALFSEVDHLPESPSEITPPEEVIEEGEIRFTETEEGKEIRRYLSDLDAVEHGVRNRADLLDHLREQGYDITKEQVDKITEKVAVFA